MSKASRTRGIRAAALSSMSPKDQQAAIDCIGAIEGANGRYLSDGRILEPGRETLVFFRNHEIVGAASIHRIPVVDMTFDTSNSRDLVAIAEFAQAFVEGALFDAGMSEYIVALPIGEGSPWVEGVAKRFDHEDFPAEQFRVFRKSV